MLSRLEYLRKEQRQLAGELSNVNPAHSIFSSRISPYKEKFRTKNKQWNGPGQKEGLAGYCKKAIDKARQSVKNNDISLF